MTGIYLITNKENGKIYIGQSKNIKQRINEHFYEARKGLMTCPRLNREIIKYGKDSFSYTVLEECPENLLNEREIYFIQKYDSTNKEIVLVQEEGSLRKSVHYRAHPIQDLFLLAI